MKGTRLIIVGVALAAGLAAAYLSSSTPRETSPPPLAAAEPPMIAAEEVLVAASALSVGTRISARDVRWLAWPTDGVTSGMILRKSNPDFIVQSAGAVVRDGFVANEPIRKEKLIKADNGFLAAILPSGKRAFAIGIDPQGTTSAGTLILPNDRIDVVQIYKDLRASKESGSDVYTSQTLLENIRVLAIGPNIEEKNGAKVAIGQTATLELDPVQVSAVALAARTGTLTLALRSVLDAGISHPTDRPEKRTVAIIRGETRQEYAVLRDDQRADTCCQVAPLSAISKTSMR
jgi:pilus assembly protein CpaB